MDGFEGLFAELKDFVPDLKYTDIHLNIYHHSENLYSMSRSPVDKERSPPCRSFIKKKGFTLMNPIMLLEYIYLKNVKQLFVEQPVRLLNANRENIMLYRPNGKRLPLLGINAVLGSLRENDYDLLRILSSKKRCSFE